ncbi:MULTISPECIES: CopG family ribbon-helix-helix protein [Planktothrix]|jgi:RHH-type transcriptional regulator, rel operon repressor / antitoxin RelB|nr:MULTISPECIES: CopG family transcriptional regulator [Planktothrix]
MNKENIMLTLDSEKKAAISAIATLMERDFSDVVNEAIASYLDINQWLSSEIERGIGEAEANDFASDEEVQGVFAKLINEN